MVWFMVKNTLMLGYKLNLKMIQKELIISRGKNQYLFSDKKKYLDFSLSSGAMILGHANSIYLKALKDSHTKGSNFSSNNINKINFEKTLKKTFPEMNDFIFSNSGSEATTRALRIARALTNKKKYAIVNGSWHGSVNEFMYDLKQIKKKTKTISLSNGIEPYKKNVVVLPCNDFKKTLKILDNNSKKISMLIVEPIQCSIPNIKMIKYLKFLYDYCKKKKIIICFDEIITGLRVKKLSIFKKYGLKPDMVTLSKCFGGGLPLGITCTNNAISKKIKKLDKNIFFGGTFSGNPLSTKTGNDTLVYYKKNQKFFNNKINKFASYLETEINQYCEKNEINFKLIRYESIVRAIFTREDITNKLDREIYDQNFQQSINFKKFLQSRYVFISSNCCFFISTCHNQKNLNHLIKIIKEFLKYRQDKN